MQNRKEVSISLRCTTDEKEELNRLAQQSNMNLSNYIVHTCLYNVKVAYPLDFLPEMLTLTNKYLDGVIKKKTYIRKIIRRIKDLCRQ